MKLLINNYPQFNLQSIILTISDLNTEYEIYFKYPVNNNKCTCDFKITITSFNDDN